MRAHIIEGSIIANTIEVESLDDFPGLIDASQGGSIGDLWDGHSFTTPVPTIPPVPIPQQVTMRQARLALLQAGLLDTVETGINAIQEDSMRKATQIEWEYAMDIRRDWPALILMTSALGITDEQLDQLFLSAALL